MRPLTILVIEDDFYFREKLKNLLKDFCQVVEAFNFSQGQTLLLRDPFDLVLIDIKLEGKMLGLELVKTAKKRSIPTIVLSDFDHMEFVERAYEWGCDHYLTKDHCQMVLVPIIKNLRESVQEHFFDRFFQEEFITQDKGMKEEIKSLKNKVKIKSETPVLILGETGTGKGKIAEMIHQFSLGAPAQNAPNFVATNVSAYQENLIEAEFMGHVKGAFTGALGPKMGLLKLAQNGTLFLDEICTMSMLMQQKLLKALEEKKFYPVGATAPEKSNFRLITATSEDIYQKIQHGFFRLDLFHRISGMTIKIPPLRERREDIPLLLDDKIKKSTRKIIIKKDAMKSLMNYDWRGNVRELFFVAENLINHSNGIITLNDLPSHIIQNRDLTQKDSNQEFIQEEHFKFLLSRGMDAFLYKMEKDIFLKALHYCRGNHGETQDILQLTKSSFYRLLKKTKEAHP